MITKKMLWHGRSLLGWITAITLFAGCGSSGNPDAYHVGAHQWVGDTIEVHVYRTSAPADRPSVPNMKVDCHSCDLTNSPTDLVFNDSGVARIYIPEAPQLVSARLHIHGSGMDTTFIQKQRSPQEATRFYHLSKPLVGRVYVDQFALLYLDTTRDSVVGSANVGDELNIFGIGTAFYAIHHPNFSNPLFLLKQDAIKLE
jgi:hypothetical protein